MTTVADLAKVANAVYKNGAINAKESATLGDWKFICPYGNQKLGFYAELYLNGKTKTFAFSIRGTDDFVNDLIINDGLILLGLIPQQTSQARESFKPVLRLAKTTKRSLYLTGHSLGGGLATLLGVENKIPVVTFNSPSMARSYASSVLIRTLGRDISWWSEKDTSKILHIEASGDLVSVGFKLGKVVKIQYKGINEIPEPKNISLNPIRLFNNPIGYIKDTGAALGEHTASALLQHQMSRIEREISKRPEFKKDLGWKFDWV